LAHQTQDIIQIPQAQRASGSQRVVAFDWMRGLVMVLMTVDHASEMFNAGRFVTDAAFLYKTGTPLPILQFLIRWMTHLCAPTFVFLAGTSLALSSEKRLKAGESAASISRSILIRGLLIAALDPLWMSWAFTPGRILLQVLFAIGMSFVCMVPLRRLGNVPLAGLALAFMVFGEALTGALLRLFGGTMPLPVAVLLSGGVFGKLIIGYPLFPWLAVMILGWVFGRCLLHQNPKPTRWLMTGGVLSLTIFVLVRGINGYGNLRLFRDDRSLAQWLHVSKYPPSLSFYSLELGLMALVLSFFLRWQQGRKINSSGLLLVLGQTAFFFYLLHGHLLLLAAKSLGVTHQRGLPETFVATAAVIGLLYPACRWYRRYKNAHPNGWARYI
jgi:uncharacterized membrane protein